MATIAGLWVADLRNVWHSPFLFWLFNTGSAAFAIAFIVIPAARQFVARGQLNVLLLGCGVLVVQLGVFAGAIGLTRDLNAGFAIFTLSALLSAVCHFAGVTLFSRRRIRLARPIPCLAVAYAGCMVAMGLAIWASLTARVPGFYSDVSGVTLLRSLVEGSATGLFALTAALLWMASRRTPSPFSHWYALGLGLLATSLIGHMAIVAGNSPLQWVARFTQALGTVYMCAAVLAGWRETRNGSIPLEGVEGIWQEPEFLAALGQHSPLGWALRYFLAVAGVAAAIGTHLGCMTLFGPGLPSFILSYPMVTMVALVGGLGPGVAATLLADIATAAWILPRIRHFAPASSMDRLGLAIFLAMGLCLSLGAELLRRYRSRAEASKRQEALIAERKRAESKLREEAIRKDEFIALLGHELRNPLVPIRNAVYLMRRARHDPALMEDALAITERQVSHIVRLVDDLLDVSRIARGKIQLKYEGIDLLEIMRNVTKDYQPILEKQDLALEVDLPSRPVRIEGDRARIVQMVTNLLSNAIKFTDPGGRIRLSVEVLDQQWCQIKVKDTGIGIAPECLTSIFEPFMQPKETIGRTQGGLGLGLALAKGLADLHGGSLSAGSDGPGKGSEFIIRLPRARLEEQPDIQVPSPAVAKDAQGRRVLVVEDLQDAAATLQLLLEMSGHTVAVAHDGPTALDKANRFEPEVILCDIGLPGAMDGYQVARTIKHTPRLARVHLIAMTGFGSPSAKEEASKAGFDAHLTKPVDPDLLRQLIDSFSRVAPPHAGAETR
jgi:signal transduction histidine kinase/ActR/RegA family two-component response regulator